MRLFHVGNTLKKEEKMLLLVKKKVKKLGHLTGDQLLFDGISILSRFPIYCDENNQISKFEVKKEFYPFALNTRPIYVMSGINFLFNCELDDAEYQVIKKILNINRMLENGKISEEVHVIKIEKFINSLIRN